MSIETIPKKPAPHHRATPLPEHKPPTPKVLPARRSFRILVALMALIPIAVVAAAVLISM